MLERREMLAADIAQNPYIPQDTNGDFHVTSLDALGVINYINARSRGLIVEGELTSTAQSLAASSPVPAFGDTPMLDVNGDSYISSLDLLSVFNKINSKKVAEGEDILAEVNLLVVDAAGNELASSMVNGVKEYVIGVGEEFFVRSKILDNRNNVAGSSALGVFGGLFDIEYENLDGTGQEKVQALYSENLRVNLSGVTGGTFRLRFNTPNGVQETGDIAIVTGGNGLVQTTPTNNNIRNAIAALPFFGGVNNITALPPISDTVNQNYTFSYNFVNQFYRVDVPDAVVTSPVLSGTNPTVTVASSLDPTKFDVFSSAIRYPQTVLPELTQPLVYNGTPVGKLVKESTSVFLIDEVGSTNPAGTNYFDTQFINLLDVHFKGSVAGKVEFTTNFSEQFDIDGITLYGNPGDPVKPLPEANIQFSTPFRVNVVDRIQAVNDVFPVSGQILEDSAAVTLANITANDIVRAGTLAGIQSVTQPAAGTGTVTFTAGGQSVVYTPGPNFFGQATFTYTVANSLGDTSVGTVTVNVTGVNDAPILIAPAPAAPTIAEDSVTPLTVAASTFFLAGPGGETGAVRFNTAALVTPGSGTVSINAAGELVFAPAANFFGDVPVRVTAIDAQSAVSTSVTVTLRVTAVNDAPTALGPQFQTNEDTNLALAGTQLFSAGPANESTQTITLSNPVLANGQTGATLSINGSGQLVIVPTANFFGTVVFSVTGTDNGSPAIATTGNFTVTVNAVNDAPTATADNFVVISFTGVEQELNVLSNDAAGPNEPNSDLRITRILNHVGGGTLRIADNGRSIFYLPPAGVPTGTASFTYEISDSTNPAIALTAQAQVNIDIVPPVLPFAVRDTRSIIEGTASINIDVMANDLINDGAKRSLVNFTQPTSGTVTRDPGTLPDSSDDKLIFTPSSPDFFGQAVFQYTLDDDATDSDPSIGTVTVVVTEVNDAPTVTNKNVTAPEDSVDFQITAATVLAGSSAGPLETTQTVSLQSARVISGGGSVAVRNGNLFYTAATNFVGNVILEYTAVDNGTTNGVADPKTATGLVTIAVTPVNDAPVTANDSATTAEDTTVDIPISTVLSNDRPAPTNAPDELANQTLSVTAVQVLSGGGSVSIVGGNIRYVPASNANGPAVIQYTVQDSETTPTAGFVALTATGQITVNITAVNDAPANLTATRSVYAGLPTIINLSAELATTSRGASNEANQTLRVSRIIPGSVQGGTATLNADGTVTFMAPTGSSGVGSFQVETIDNGTTNGASDPKTAGGTVTINISPFQPSQISGKVWVDNDGDNVVDGPEHLVGGVTVKLERTAGPDVGVFVNPTIVTGADGSFNFDILPPGTYTVSYVHPNGAGDGATANSMTYTIAVPGGSNIVTNFSITGVNVQFASVLDNLAAGYYNDHPEARGKGIDAVINADGSMAFSSIHGGYTNVKFAEVVITNNGRDAVLSLVAEDMSVRTAIIPRGKYFVTRAPDGTTYVKIVALESELTFFGSGNAPASAKASSNYLDSVDSYFANLGK